MIVTARGRADLLALKERFERAGREKLRHELNKAGEAGGEHVAKAVRHTTDLYMPRGYEAIWRRALITKVVSRVSVSRRVTVSGRAFGSRGHDRQAEELEAGVFRRPVWGRYRPLTAGGKYVKRPRNLVAGRYRNPWVSQRVRPHWFTEPGVQAAPAFVREIDAAAERVAGFIEHGAL